MSEGRLSSLLSSCTIQNIKTKQEDVNLNVEAQDGDKEKEDIKANGNEEKDETDDDDNEVTEKVLKPVGYQWPASIPCLIRGKDELHTCEDLRIPVATLPFLSSFVTHEKFEPDTVEWQNGCDIDGCHNEICRARVVGTAELTDGSNSKLKREIIIDVGRNNEVQTKYLAGDSFYFLIPNPREEVNLILQRMNLLTVADQKCVVTIKSNTQKRNAVVPPYIPQNSSIRYLLTYCLDIRRAPGRPLLRVLAEHASDPKEARRLLELCSAQGVEEFTRFVRCAGISLADLLFAFPSIRPPADRILELLPRLMPRPYSVASFYRHNRHRVRFVYSLVKFSAEDGRNYTRYGLASGWLSSLKVGDEVMVMTKKSSFFSFPILNGNGSGYNTPLIMIGPGTGVAPFLSFLHYIEMDRNKHKSDPDVDRILFFGCRSIEQDFIYREELESYESNGMLSELVVCESRPANESETVYPKYVQHALLQRGKKIAEMLTRQVDLKQLPAYVYVCGDAKGMSKDVWSAFVNILKDHTGKTEEEANKLMMEIKRQHKYIEDVWS